MNRELANYIEALIEALEFEERDRFLVHDLWRPLAERLAEYCALLADWSRRVDLVAPASSQTLAERHLIDSLGAYLAIRAIGVPESADVLDIGSGAGLPGAVFALISPHWRVTLCEPRQRRADFLREVRRRLSLQNLAVAQHRMEDLSGERFDLITTRALGAREEFLKTGSRVLRPNGIAAELVGPSFTRTDQEALAFLSLKPYTLPISNAAHAVAAWRQSVSRETPPSQSRTSN